MIYAESHSSGMETPEITNFEVISNNGVVEIEQEPEYFNVTGLRAGTAIIKCTVVNYDSNFDACTAISTYTINVTEETFGGEINFSVGIVDSPDTDETAIQYTRSFTALEGMTFLDWLNSDYAPDDAARTDPMDVEGSGYPDTVWLNGNFYISSADINSTIIANETYLAHWR